LAGKKAVADSHPIKKGMAKMNKSSLTILVSLLALCREAEAERIDSASYTCIVKYSLSLQKDGSTRPHRNEQAFRNREFTVDRASGQMRGVIDSQRWGKHEVWDRGSDEASYKAIYALPPPDVEVALLQIRELEPEADKSFLLVVDTSMLTGTCTHLK
jgi:hypothetical protein